MGFTGRLRCTGWITSGSARVTTWPRTPCVTKKTADPPADPGPAAAEGGPGRGRDRPAAVPTLAGRLVEARRSRPCLAEWPQCAASDLRGDEPADRDPAVPAATEGA